MTKTTAEQKTSQNPQDQWSREGSLVPSPNTFDADRSETKVMEEAVEIVEQQTVERH